MAVKSLDLISDAFRLARVIGDDEDPDRTQLRTGLVVLSDLLSHWQTDQDMKWLCTSGWFALRPGERMYLLGPDGDFGERVVEMFDVHVEQNGVQPIRVHLVDHATFLQKPPRSVGRPIDAYLESGTDRSLLYLWPTPNSEAILKFSFQREIENPKVMELLEIPREWVRAVKYNLAAELCPRYGLPVPETVYGTALSAKYEQSHQSVQGGEFIVTPPMDGYYG